MHNRFAALDGLDLSYVISRCDRCGFHFASRLPVDAVYARYYAELSKYDSQPSVSPLDQQRCEAAVALLAGHVSRDARILDIGCGFGALLAALRDAGWARLVGLDPALHSARQARECFGLECVREGWLRDAPTRVDLTEVDVACLMAVLEHLPHLERDLLPVMTAMRPGSLLLVEVPALEAFHAELGEPFGELSMEHIQYFGDRSLGNLFSRLGGNVLAHRRLALPGIHSGSLFVLVEMGRGGRGDIHPEDPGHFDAYIAGSRKRLRAALGRVPAEPFVLYGAGSHSARLLPLLEDDQRSNIVAVLDGNTNLQGRRFGDFCVQPPSALAMHPGRPVLISSYRSAAPIARSLSGRFPNPLLTMYDALAA